MSLFFSWPNADAAMSRTVTLATIVFMLRMPHLRGVQVQRTNPQKRMTCHAKGEGIECRAALSHRGRDLRSSTDAHILRSRSPPARRSDATGEPGPTAQHG